jgi:hypothetical protein
MPVIFVSYRRSDSQDVTGRIYDRLVAKFSQKQVFKDVDNIPLGVSFPVHIKQMLRKASVLLVIMGPDWLTATDEQGRRRLDDPADFVRIEVELALRADMPVVPVLVGTARMPLPSELPPSMRKLVLRNGMAVRPDPDFNHDMGRLFAGIDNLEKLRSIRAGKSAKSTDEEILTGILVPDQSGKEGVRDSSAITVKRDLTPRAKENPSGAPRQRPPVRRAGTNDRSGRGWILLLILALFIGAVSALVLGRQLRAPDGGSPQVSSTDSKGQQPPLADEKKPNSSPEAPKKDKGQEKSPDEDKKPSSPPETPNKEKGQDIPSFKKQPFGDGKKTESPKIPSTPSPFKPPPLKQGITVHVRVGNGNTSPGVEFSIVATVKIGDIQKAVRVDQNMPTRSVQFQLPGPGQYQYACNVLVSVKTAGGQGGMGGPGSGVIRCEDGMRLELAFNDSGKVVLQKQ